MIVLLAFAVGTAWSDIPAAWREWMARDEAAFRSLTVEVRRRTDERVHEGEWDHLIYYVLQSRRFTKLAPVEPALSAREFQETGRTPESARRRIDEFLAQTAGGGPQDPRFQWARRQSEGEGREKLVAEYRRSMSFLYEKEWASRAKDGAGRRDFVARLYQDRGHSTDTSAAAAETAATGLSILRELYPGRPLQQTLVIGPGLDVAPRTGFNEDSPPRSPQMELLRAATCADVNPRVVQALGCEKLNVITERLERRFDLIVVTNVLLYFGERELALALINIRGMLKPGGFLIHNELRPEAERLCRDLDLPAVHARTIRMNGASSLYDAVVIHQAGTER